MLSKKSTTSELSRDAGSSALIGIEAALAIRSMADALGLRRSKLKGTFTCKACGQPVAPHRHGQPGQGPHFEHYRNNENNCKKDYKQP